MKGKVCSNPECLLVGIEQPLENFHKTKSNKSGYTSRCKACKKKYDELHYKDNQETKKEYQQQYRLTHKEEIQKQSKEYNQKNKEIIYKKRKIYVSKNRKKINRYSRKYNRFQRKNNLEIRIKDNLRSRLYQAVKNEWKSGSAVRDLGCSISFLKECFKPMFTFVVEENQMMSWDNYGKLWHIDHIIPLSAFDLTDREQLKRACHYTNLRPLWAKQNCSERDRGLARKK